MATSLAQITANRANPHFSTGPVTAEGKLTSSQNSVTTGLTAVKLFIRPEEQDTFNTFKSDLTSEMKPGGALQNHIFGILLHAAWNLRRCQLLELEIQEDAFTRGLDDPTLLAGHELGRKLDRVYRYRKMHESAQRRAMADLRQLQTEQLWRRENKVGEHESILADTTKVELRAGQRNATQQRANLDVLRQHIESFIAPPVLPHQRR
ncbi:MAG TPA: hypothetical protein VGL53_28395 [Bryobacteraceae bacterium]